MLKRMLRPSDRRRRMHRSGEPPWIYHMAHGAAMVERTPRCYKLRRALKGVRCPYSACAAECESIPRGTIVHGIGRDVFISDVHWIETERFGYIPVARRDELVGVVLLAKLELWDPAPWDPDAEILVQCYGSVTRAEALAEHAHWESTFRRRALRATWGDDMDDMDDTDDTDDTDDMDDMDDADDYRLVTAAYQKGGLTAVEGMLREIHETITATESVVQKGLQRMTYNSCAAMYTQLLDEERDWAVLMARKQDCGALPQWVIDEHPSAARTLTHNSALARAHADCKSITLRERTLARQIRARLDHTLECEIAELALVDQRLRQFHPSKVTTALHSTLVNGAPRGGCARGAL